MQQFQLSKSFSLCVCVCQVTSTGTVRRLVGRTSTPSPPSPACPTAQRSLPLRWVQMWSIHITDGLSAVISYRALMRPRWGQTAPTVGRNETSDMWWLRAEQLTLDFETEDGSAFITVRVMMKASSSSVCLGVQLETFCTVHVCDQKRVFGRVLSSAGLLQAETHCLADADGGDAACPDLTLL